MKPKETPHAVRLLCDHRPGGSRREPSGLKGTGPGPASWYQAGGGMGLYHQGGNLPFFRSLPFKRGFTPPNRVAYNEINLDQLEGFRANSKVNPETLIAANLLRKPKLPVVLMGRGDVKKALKISVHRITKGAQSKIEAAGGTVEILE